jgi:hypothetical protein
MVFAKPKSNAPRDCPQPRKAKSFASKLCPNKKGWIQNGCSRLFYGVLWSIAIVSTESNNAIKERDTQEIATRSEIE